MNNKEGLHHDARLSASPLEGPATPPVMHDDSLLFEPLDILHEEKTPLARDGVPGPFPGRKMARRNAICTEILFPEYEAKYQPQGNAVVRPGSQFKRKRRNAISMDSVAYHTLRAGHEGHDDEGAQEDSVSEACPTRLGPSVLIGRGVPCYSDIDAESDSRSYSVRGTDEETEMEDEEDEEELAEVEHRSNMEVEGAAATTPRGEKTPRGDKTPRRRRLNVPRLLLGNLSYSLGPGGDADVVIETPRRASLNLPLPPDSYPTSPSPSVLSLSFMSDFGEPAVGTRSSGDELLCDMRFTPWLYSESELSALVVKGFERFDLLRRCSIDRTTLLRFVDQVRLSYEGQSILPSQVDSRDGAYDGSTPFGFAPRSEAKEDGKRHQDGTKDKKRNVNPFHNFHRAVDVFQMTVVLLVQGGAEFLLDHLQITSLLLSALCMDMGHTGSSNQLERESMSELAVTYNDKHVMEHHHSSLLFRLLRQPETNILANLSRAEFRQVRTSTIDCILSSDPESRLDVLSRFQTLKPLMRSRMCDSGGVMLRESREWPTGGELLAEAGCSSGSSEWKDDSETPSSNGSVEAAEAQDMMNFLLLVADVSFVARPLYIAQRWVHFRRKEEGLRSALWNQLGPDAAPGNGGATSFASLVREIVVPSLEVLGRVLFGGRDLRAMATENTKRLTAQS